MAKEIYFKVEDICKAFQCYCGFVPYRVKGEDEN